MGYIDVRDKMCWRQLCAVGDGFGRFCHQISVGHQQPKDVTNIEILSLTFENCHQDKVTNIFVGLEFDNLDKSHHWLNQNVKSRHWLWKIQKEYLARSGNFYSNSDTGFRPFRPDFNKDPNEEPLLWSFVLTLLISSGNFSKMSCAHSRLLRCAAINKAHIPFSSTQSFDAPLSSSFLISSRFSLLSRGFYVINRLDSKKFQNFQSQA